MEKTEQLCLKVRDIRDSYDCADITQIDGARRPRTVQEVFSPTPKYRDEGVKSLEEVLWDIQVEETLVFLCDGHGKCEIQAGNVKMYVRVPEESLSD